MPQRPLRLRDWWWVMMMMSTWISTLRHPSTHPVELFVKSYLRPSTTTFMLGSTRLLPFLSFRRPLASGNENCPSSVYWYMLFSLVGLWWSTGSLKVSPVNRIGSPHNEWIPPSSIHIQNSSHVLNYILKIDQPVKSKHKHSMENCTTGQNEYTPPTKQWENL